MSETERQPSWKRFENFEGPSPDEEYRALRGWNLKKAGMHNAQEGNIQGSGRLMFGTPRLGKCRDLKVGGLRLK